jgi:integrase
MASIALKTLKNGNQTWAVTVRVVGHPTVCQSFSNEEDARAFAAAKDKEFGANNYRQRVPEEQIDYLTQLRETKMADLIERWKTSGNYTEHCLNAVPSAVRLVCNDKVGQLGRKWLKAFIARVVALGKKRRKAYSWGTIQSLLLVVRQAIAWECDEHDLEPLPFPSLKGIIPRKWTDRRERRLEPEEESILFDHLSKFRKSAHWKCLITLALETGARLQEMVLMEWRELSLDGLIWTIPKEHCKTSVTRHVLLSSRAREVIEQMRGLRQGSAARVFEAVGKPKSVSIMFTTMMRKTGIKDFRFHDLRHEGISRMVAKGDHSVDIIMHMTGHSDYKSHRRYTHLRPSDLLNLASKAQAVRQETATR